MPVGYASAFKTPLLLSSVNGHVANFSYSFCARPRPVADMHCSVYFSVIHEKNIHCAMSGNHALQRKKQTA
jgi:hypothetical protein